MRPITDGQKFSNISANTASFQLLGGLYGCDVIATGTGTVTAQKLAADGATWVTALTAFATTSGFATAYLPPGTYRFAIATFTAVYIDLSRIPSE
jgi:hypothetical protein